MSTPSLAPPPPPRPNHVMWGLLGVAIGLALIAVILLIDDGSDTNTSTTTQPVNTSVTIDVGG